MPTHCTHCGKPLNINSSYCLYCGAQVPNRLESAPPSPSSIEEAAPVWAAPTPKPRGNGKKGFIIAGAILLLLALVLTNGWTYLRMKDYERAVAQRDDTIKGQAEHAKTLDEQIIALKEQVDLLDKENLTARSLYEDSILKAGYVDENLVFVQAATRIYHTFDCYRNDPVNFTAMDEDLAKLMNYTPCERCIGDEQGGEWSQGGENTPLHAHP